MTVSDTGIRKLYREQGAIAALRTIRAVRPDCGLPAAQAKLKAMLTDEDRAVWNAVFAARGPDPWVESAPGIFEPKSQVTPRGGGK